MTTAPPVLYRELIVSTRRPDAPTGRTMMADLVVEWPAARAVLGQHGMACVGCSMARFETIAEAARAYGLRASDLIDDVRRGTAQVFPGGRSHAGASGGRHGSQTQVRRRPARRRRETRQR
ncbi:MAG: DUF1858 domain-containing protein [Acidobacteria bacterium]|nr:DUF1858 domain-containing protein [Acidobacteriota bacterium]